MSFERRYFNSSDYSVRAVEDETGKRFLEGYASVFNVRSRLILENREIFYEEIKPGAYENVLQKSGLDVIFTFNHSRDRVLARTTSGTLKLAQDDKGLYFRAEIDPEVSDAKDLWHRVKRGDISENSFAFRVSEEDYEWSGRSEDGLPIRVIHNISDLRDVSSVTNAAYPETSVSARELSEIKGEEKEEIETDQDKERKELESLKLKTRIKIIQLKNKD